MIFCFAEKMMVGAKECKRMQKNETKTKLYYMIKGHKDPEGQDLDDCGWRDGGGKGRQVMSQLMATI